MPADTLLARELAAIERGAYLKRLGVEVGGVGDGRAELRLPYREETANRGGSVHGGALASAMLVAGSLAAASSEREGGASSGRPLTLAASFLRAPRGEGIDAHARVLHRGRDTVHVSVEVATRDGEQASVGEVVYRVGATEPGEVDGAVQGSVAERVAALSGDSIGASPYLRSAGMEVFDAFDDWACARIPLGPNEGERGYVHEGAIAGLADTCGAFSAYAHAGVGRDTLGVTVALQMAFARPGRGDLAGGGRLLARTGVAFTNEVEIWSCEDGRVTTAALVSYRIVQP